MGRRSAARSLTLLAWLWAGARPEGRSAALAKWGLWARRALSAVGPHASGGQFHDGALTSFRRLSSCSRSGSRGGSRSAWAFALSSSPCSRRASYCLNSLFRPVCIQGSGAAGRAVVSPPSVQQCGHDMWLSCNPGWSPNAAQSELPQPSCRARGGKGCGARSGTRGKASSANAGKGAACSRQNRCFAPQPRFRPRSECAPRPCWAPTPPAPRTTASWAAWAMLLQPSSRLVRLSRSAVKRPARCPRRATPGGTSRPAPCM